MAKGFIYVVASVNKDYQQEAFRNVPTEFESRLFLGPCKRSMRPRMQRGDFIFGLSPAKAGHRRILFAARIEARMTFREAYERFVKLRGPDGPIHVRPVSREGRFPFCSYEHIENAMHSGDWQRDLLTESRDAFFVCQEAAGWMGKWLGHGGPQVDPVILDFLRSCEVYGNAGQLRENNDQATIGRPVAHGGLSVGLHLETMCPEVLLGMLSSRLGDVDGTAPANVALSKPGGKWSGTGHCGGGKL